MCVRWTFLAIILSELYSYTNSRHMLKKIDQHLMRTQKSYRLNRAQKYISRQKIINKLERERKIL
jgi:hypothetical protein